MKSTTAAIGEIVVSATKEALNAAIAKRDIKPDNIIRCDRRLRREMSSRQPALIASFGPI
jgi:hypothetical protein